VNQISKNETTRFETKTETKAKSSIDSALFDQHSRLQSRDHITDVRCSS